MYSHKIARWSPGGYRDLRLPHNWANTSLPPIAERVDDALRESWKPAGVQMEVYSFQRLEVAHSLPASGQADVPELLQPPQKEHSRTAPSFPLWPPILFLIGLWLMLCWNARVDTGRAETERDGRISPLRQSAEAAAPYMREAARQQGLIER